MMLIDEFVKTHHLASVIDQCQAQTIVTFLTLEFTFSFHDRTHRYTNVTYYPRPQQAIARSVNPVNNSFFLQTSAHNNTNLVIGSIPHPKPKEKTSPAMSRGSTLPPTTVSRSAAFLVSTLSQSKDKLSTFPIKTHPSHRHSASYDDSMKNRHGLTNFFSCTCAASKRKECQ